MLVVRLQRPRAGAWGSELHSYQCPTCQKITRVASPQDAPHRPFCSHRCKMIDLGQWFNEVYRTSEPATPEDLDRAGLAGDSE